MKNALCFEQTSPLAVPMYAFGFSNTGLFDRASVSEGLLLEPDDAGTNEVCHRIVHSALFFVHPKGGVAK